MDPLLARYPFLDAARDAVTESGSSLEAILGEEGQSAAVDRGVDRIMQALTTPTIGDPRRDDEVELLSYPIARIIVSLVDDRRVTNRYVQAEGRTAAERFKEDQTRRHREGTGLDHQRVFEEFDIDARSRQDGYDIDVVDYLIHSVELEEDRWHLVNRRLDDGWVPITEGEFPRLLEAAVRGRIGRDLPLAVPGEIEDRLTDPVTEIEAAVGAVRLPESFDVVDPDAFPPCMVALVERAEAETTLPPAANYALTSFLTSLGLAPEELNRVLEEPVADSLVDMANTVSGDEGPTQFPPGSCETMDAYGVCVNQDELCETIEHPLEYYERRLEEVRN